MMPPSTDPILPHHISLVDKQDALARLSEKHLRAKVRSHMGLPHIFRSRVLVEAGQRELLRRGLTMEPKP